MGSNKMHGIPQMCIINGYGALHTDVHRRIVRELLNTPFGNEHIDAVVWGLGRFRWFDALSNSTLFSIG